MASVIFGRLSTAVGGEITPASILKLRPARMRKLGLSTQKTAYIRDLARHTRDGTVVFEELPATDRRRGDRALTKVKGIGVWTAHMFLMFALRRTDVLPAGDLGIRSAIRKAYNLAEMPHRRDGADRAPLAALLLGGELVPVAQSGLDRKDLMKEIARSASQFQIFNPDSLHRVVIFRQASL